MRLSPSRPRVAHRGVKSTECHQPGDLSVPLPEVSRYRCRIPTPRPPPGVPSAATGRGRDQGPPNGPRGEGVDPPTVRLGSAWSGRARTRAARRGRLEARADLARSRSPCRAGRSVDVFLLEESIGAGGMGAVFRAVDTRLDRHVALKILPPGPGGRPRGRPPLPPGGAGGGPARPREHRPGLHDRRRRPVPLHRLRIHRGVTIRQKVEAEAPLPVAEAIDYTLQIAGALVHAADRGVVHRDIKPSNIIVTPRGGPSSSTWAWPGGSSGARTPA